MYSSERTVNVERVAVSELSVTIRDDTSVVSTVN